MIHSIKIGKLIYARLTQDQSLITAIGNNKVFPIVAENETKFPFVTYTRTGVSPAKQTKDGRVEDIVTFQVSVCSDSYNESLDVADKVRELLEIKLMSSDELAMIETYMTGITELYDSNTYIQQMQFTTRVQNVYTPEQTQNG